MTSQFRVLLRSFINDALRSSMLCLMIALKRTLIHESNNYQSKNPKLIVLDELSSGVPWGSKFD